MFSSVPFGLPDGRVGSRIVLHILTLNADIGIY